MNLMNIVFLIVAYLIGSFPSGVIVGKLFYQTDIREHGSKNTGTTNAWRVLGPKAGIAVFILDMAKGAIACSFSSWFGLSWHPLIFGLAAILGHVYPVFMNFQGGKAVATAAGVGFAFNPLFLFIHFPIIFFSVLYLTSMVSLTSMITVTIALLASLFLQDWFFTFFVFLVWLLIMSRHKDNLKRIKAGTESKIPWGHGYKKEQKNK